MKKNFWDTLLGGKKVRCSSLYHPLDLKNDKNTIKNGNEIGERHSACTFTEYP